jgi:formylglycine-generating enzyme required for sulfatase activity
VGKYYESGNIRDMIGNVWEWVSPSAFDKESSYVRPVKGGGFADLGESCYIAFTAYSSPKVKVRDRGFRCAVSFDRLYENHLRKIWKLPEIKEEFKDEPGMVYITKGPFAHGETETTQFTPAFFIDEAEVTNADYAKFLETLSPAERKARTPLSWSEGSIPAGQEKHPATMISWLDAKAYAAWAGKRLPTPQEWEKACRGGGKVYRKFPYGREFGKLCHTKESAYGMYQNSARPVKSQIPGQSFFGCHNMGGNVSEWVDMQNPSAPIYYMGASFMKPGEKWPAWQKGQSASNEKLPDVGFRLVKDVKE